MAVAQARCEAAEAANRAQELHAQLYAANALQITGPPPYLASNVRDMHGMNYMPSRRSAQY